MSPTGYSNTNLAKKLGIKPGFFIKLINPPDYYFDLVEDLPDDIEYDSEDDIKKDMIHFFTKDINELYALLGNLKNEIKQNGCIWVSWPKKASNVSTTVNGDVIRNLAVNIGLIDAKVCAVDEIWSGLKLVIPVKLRTT